MIAAGNGSLDILLKEFYHDVRLKNNAGGTVKDICM